MSPISDTTIISVNTMKVNLFDTLRERLKVSIICLTISSIVYIILGQFLVTGFSINANYVASLKPLIMLSTFLLMIILLIRKYDMISVLLLCDIYAIFISIIFKFIDLKNFFSQDSCIISGIEGVFGVIVFWIFLFILIGFIPDKFVAELIEKKVNNSKNTVRTNLIAVLIIILSILTVSNNTAAMSIISKFIDKSFKNKTQVEKANIYDGISCAIPGLLPYNTAFMLMVSLAFDTGCLPSDFSVLSIVMFSINSMLLLIAYVIMALYNPKNRRINVNLKT